MARTDRQAFLRQLVVSEKRMDEMFHDLAVEIGNAVLRAQGADGKVPPAHLPGLRREAAGMVMARFVGADGRAFGDTNEPLAEFPGIIAEGQRAMIELALERTAKILDDALPDDLRVALAGREIIA